MSRPILRPTLVVLAIAVSSAHQASAALASTAAAQGAFSFWFEARGLPPGDAEIVAAGFADEARDAERLAVANRPLEADLIVRMTVGAAAMSLNATGPQMGGAAAGPEPDALVAPEFGGGASVEVHLSLVDIFAGAVLAERRAECEMPLTRGRFVAAPCLRSGFAMLVAEMEEWAEREAAAAASVDEFGPDADDLRRLDAAGLARAFYAEGVSALRAGFAEQALNLMAEAQPRFKETGLRADEGAAWEYLAFLMAVTHRGMERAVDYAEQTVRIARELSDEAAEARALNLLAACEARMGNYTRAARVARAATSQAREVGDVLAEGTGVAIQAGVAAAKGDFDRAHALYDDALTLLRSGGSPRAEARVMLAVAVVTAHDDDRVRSASLAQLEEVASRAREIGDLALLRDVTFLKADARYGTTEFDLVIAGEVDAIRALKLARRLDDHVGEAAAVGLLGAFALRLGKPSVGFDYLALAQELSREAGFAEGMTDSVQLLGEYSPDPDRGAALLEEVAGSRSEHGDLRGRIKTLADASRLLAGLERHDEAWDAYVRAADALQEYVAALQGSPDHEDLRESFSTVLKSVVATRTDLPFLAGYLRLNHVVPLPNPSWFDGASR